jgi:hypothetical protein
MQWLADYAACEWPRARARRGESGGSRGGEGRRRAAKGGEGLIEGRRDKGEGIELKSEPSCRGINPN